MNSAILAVKIPDELKRAVKVEAAKQGQTLTQLVQNTLAQKVGDQHQVKGVANGQ